MSAQPFQYMTTVTAPGMPQARNGGDTPEAAIEAAIANMTTVCGWMRRPVPAALVQTVRTGTGATDAETGLSVTLDWA